MFSSGVIDFGGGGGSSTAHPPSIADLTSVGGTLYFSIDRRRIWRTDGTAAGTREVADFPSNDLYVNPYVGEFADFAGTLFFAARSADVGVELWRTDGTAGGTRLVKDVHGGVESSSPRDLTVIGRWLYFIADGTLWKSDGTTNGTISLGVQAEALQAVGDTLYFTNSTELWKTDGTAGGTVRLTDATPSTSSWEQTLTDVGGKLFALLRHPQTSTMALWSSDGTPTGTREVAIVRYDPSKNSSGVREERWEDVAVLWGRMFFNGITSKGKHAIYVTDGTTAGTSIFSQTSEPGGVPGDVPVELETVGGRLYFGNFFENRGEELWVTNGKASNTHLVANLQPRRDGRFEGGLIGFNGAAYFVSTTSSGRGSVYRSDGTTAGTRAVAENGSWGGAWDWARSAATSDAVFFTNSSASQLVSIGADGQVNTLSPMLPYATLDARDTSAAPGSTYTFKVTYHHHDPDAGGGFDLDNFDIYVTGPNGYNQPATFVEVDYGFVGPRTAVYSIPAPGGSWNNVDKGTYWIWMRPYGVSDSAGAVPAGPLGSFLVRPVTGTTGDVSGVVFNDLDADGFVDEGELAYEGFRIWADLNNDGRFQPNEPNARSGAGGRYDIANVPTRTFHVRQTAVEGWELFTPDQLVRVFPDSSAEANFIAQYEPHSGQIFGTIFYDTNGNGRRDAKEGVLKGFTVYLDRNDNQQLDASEQKVVTGLDGSYAFTGLDAGTYRLRQVIVGGDWEISSVAGVTITLKPGGADTASFGNFLFGTAQVSGYIRYDSNGNGQLDWFESSLPFPYSRMVIADVNSNGVLDAGERGAMIREDGSFTIPGLLAGSYHITCTVPDAGWAATSPTTVDVSVKSGGKAQVSFFQSQKALIAGYVFNDIDRNGQAIAGEPMLAGWRVYLDENGNGQYDRGERTSMTDETGRYEFAGLFGRTYSLGLTGTGDWTAVTPTYATVKTTGGRTMNQHFAVAQGGIIKGAALRRVPNSNDLPEPNVLVFVDGNDNGVLDAGEPSARSQSNGVWMFGGLSAGTYIIRAVGGSPALRQISLAVNQIRSLVYFWVN
jgi:ELWxxDGT repeat protein